MTDDQEAPAPGRIEPFWDSHMKALALDNRIMVIRALEADTLTDVEVMVEDAIAERDECLAEFDEGREGDADSVATVK